MEILTSAGEEGGEREYREGREGRGGKILKSIVSPSHLERKKKREKKKNQLKIRGYARTFVYTVYSSVYCVHRIGAGGTHTV